MPVNIPAYSFEELEENIKEEIRDRYRRDGIDHWQCDDITNSMKELLEPEGLPSDQIHWSLGYCQGDGVAFRGTVDLEEYTLFHNLREWGAVEDCFSVQITLIGRHYHKNSMVVNLDQESGAEEHPQAFWILQFADKLEEHIENRVKEVSGKLEELGYKEIEYYQSAGYIDDIILGQENLYLADGTLAEYKQKRKCAV